MDPRDMDSDFYYIYKYLQVKSHSLSSFENDLTLTIEAIHRQVSVFEVLRTDWEHLKSNETFVLGGQGEQVLLITELLRTAEQTVDKIKMLATRFVLTDRLFEAQTQNGRINPTLRRDWLNKKHKFDIQVDRVLEFVIKKTRDFESTIDLLNREKRKSETRLKELDQGRRQEVQRKQLLLVLREEMELANQATTKKIKEMEEKVKGQQAEIARLEEVIRSKEREQMGNPEPKRLQVTINASDEKKRDVTFEQGSAMETDDDYFERMVQEVQEDEDMADVEQADDEDNHEDSAEQPEREEILRLCELALELEQVLQRFPYRDIGDSSVKDDIVCVFCNAVSLHYSDSCPQVRRGRDRYWIALQKQVCELCLSYCRPGGCRFRPRVCWYCSRIRGTIVDDLIPTENHHRALCEVPDRKAEVRDRLRRVQQEIEELRARE